jgi:fatty-acyl-CoA synthase
MSIQVTTIGDLVDHQAQRSHNDALVMPGARLTYPQLSELTDRVAASLLALGVGRGDKVAVLMPNTIDYVAALIASAKLGAITVPINGRFKVHECSHVVGHSDAKILITAADPHGTDYPALIGEVFPELRNHCAADELELASAPFLRRIVNLDSTTPGGCLTRADFERAGERINVEQVKAMQARVRVRDIALLVYTSGTTARPKGCLLTHEALTRHGENIARTRFLLTEQDSFWDPLPLFHCGGIVPMFGCFAVGAKFCHPGFFEPKAALRTMEQERCTVLYPTFEPIWCAVLDHPDFAATDLSAVRLIQNVAAPARLAQFEARMPFARQMPSYGSTECAANLTIPLPDDPYEVRMHTSGRPIDGLEVQIVDPETGTPLEPGQMGELCWRGYCSFEGYYKDDRATATAFDDDGWFHSGDRASVDPAGNLVYGGRLKDMLKVGGENVASIEIEGYLVRHPAVAIAQVVGVPDARYDEVPAAFVQLVPGQALLESELVEFCRGAIATYKVPRYVRFVTEWPMSGTKVQKFVLKERLTAELAAAGITEAPKVISNRSGRVDVR